MTGEPQWIWEHPLLRIEELYTSEGEKRLIVHRGSFAAVCLHLVTPSGEDAFLLIRQRRPTAETEFYEHPAGMLEPNEAPVEAALREIAEETGWLLSAEDLIALFPHPLYPSPAFWKEKGYFYAARLQVPPAVLTAYKHPVERLADQERLHLVAIPPQRVWILTQNLQTIAHTLLYYAYLGTPYRILSSDSP
ncbi:MAG: NUDIX hydrolase [Bacteroidia bacterium]|nr:NUDIX hydrolase [Bacteroidia bacterium]